MIKNKKLIQAIDIGIMGIVVYFCFFSKGLLARILYPLECRWTLNVGSWNIIDSNILHVVAFVYLGMRFMSLRLFFKVCVLLFVLGAEFAQSLISKTRDFTPIDLFYNILGFVVGVGLNSLWRKALRSLRKKK